MASIIRRDGRRVRATYVRHLRTLTTGSGSGRDNEDVDLYRLPDGTEVECISPAGDCRVTPREVAGVGHYPGHPTGA